jgi:hypothetical protein
MPFLALKEICRDCAQYGRCDWREVGVRMINKPIEFSQPLFCFARATSSEQQQHQSSCYQQRGPSKHSLEWHEIAVSLTRTEGQSG